MNKPGIAVRLALAGLTVFLMLVLFAQPYFALSRSEGQSALVVEGWIHADGLRSAKALFEEGNYEHLYVTGTLRPFTYYLSVGDTLEVKLKEPTAALWEMELTGLPGAEYEISTDGVGVDGAVLSKAIAQSSWSSAGDTIEVLRITARSQHPPPHGEALLFILGSRIAGMDLHRHGAVVRIKHPDGSISEGTASHAQQGAILLSSLGLAPELITAVPSFSSKDRTRSGAEAMARYARLNALEGYDVATLGVHARRTWIRYQAAYPEARIGILALPDPLCQRWSWWLHSYGWFQVTKELLAWPSTWFVSHASLDQEQSLPFRHASP